MVGVVGAVVALAPVVGVILTFLVLMNQHMIRSKRDEERLMHRHKNIRYIYGDLASELLHANIDERDDPTYQFLRTLLIGERAGRCELMFGLESLRRGGPARVEKLDHDPDRLEDALGSMLIESNLYHVAGHSRFKLTVRTVDLDTLGTVANFVPYYLMNAEDEFDDLEELKPVAAN